MSHTQFQIVGCQTVHSSYSLVLPHLRRYAFIPVCSAAHASHPTPTPTPLPFAAATPLPIQSSSSRRSRPTALSNLRYIRSGAEARWGQPFPTPADGAVAPAPQTPRSEEWAWIECGRSTPWRRGEALHSIAIFPRTGKEAQVTSNRSLTRLTQMNHPHFLAIFPRTGEDAPTQFYLHR